MIAELVLVALQQFDVLHLLLRSIDDRGCGDSREEKGEYKLGEVHDGVIIGMRLLSCVIVEGNSTSIVDYEAEEGGRLSFYASNAHRVVKRGCDGHKESVNLFMSKKVQK